MPSAQGNNAGPMLGVARRRVGSSNSGPWDALRNGLSRAALSSEHGLAVQDEFAFLAKPYLHCDILSVCERLRTKRRSGSRPCRNAL